MRKKYNLDEVLSICEKGRYITEEGKEYTLQLSPEMMRWAQYISPFTIYTLLDALPQNTEEKNACRIEVWNMDCLEAAKKMKQNASTRVAVLNFSNPLSPGGSVKSRGWVAQEEGICARSTAYLSLNSDRAKAYYDYNKRHFSFQGNDGILYSSNVEVFKDFEGRNIEPFTISLVSMHAPQCSPFTKKLEDTTAEEMHHIWLQRINCLFMTLVLAGHRNLVLGAFGCGVYCNQPLVVGSAFREALQTFGCYFDYITFAIPATDENDENYKAFREIFEGEEKE